MASGTSAERVVEDLRVELFRRRISQDRIAASTGMSQSGISRRLNGEVSPTLNEVELIASAAGLRVHIELISAPTPTGTDAGAPAPSYGAPALSTSGAPEAPPSAASPKAGAPASPEERG